MRRIIATLDCMKKSSQLLLTVVFAVTFGVANASTASWYGYARTCFNGESWQNKFITFSTQNPGEVQPVSETMPELWAATYLDGYVWFVTTTRSLCKAPFDEETQTIGNYETVVPELEQYNLYIDMAYNPVDGMMYYLCQDSQYNTYLKRSDITTLSGIEVVGNLGMHFWTLAINGQGEAYGITYENGDLYRIDLSNAATTLVGSTGKEPWYTQSMAFDLDTGELYWAQFTNASDHGLYQVDTETATLNSLGVIGLGTELTGLFMVPEANDPAIISEIYLEGFTAPEWDQHANYSLEVPDGAPYSITTVNWWWSSANDSGTVGDDTFNNEDVAYFMSVELAVADGYSFAEDVTVYFNGDASQYNASNSYSLGFMFIAMTIDYYVADDDVAEQTACNLTLWPNPATNVVYIEGLDGEKVQVYDAMGRMVMQQLYDGKLDVSNLPEGVYAIKVKGYTLRLMIID